MEFTKVLVILAVCLSMTIVQSLSAESENVDNPTGMPICWAKIDNCNKDQTGYGLFSPQSEGFSLTCCPVVKQQIEDAKCFCSIKSYVLSLPLEKSETVTSSALDLDMNTLLENCKFDGYSFAGICKGVKSASNKIAAIGLLPAVVVLIWTISVSY